MYPIMSASITYEYGAPFQPETQYGAFLPQPENGQTWMAQYPYKEGQLYFQAALQMPACNADIQQGSQVPQQIQRCKNNMQKLTKCPCNNYRSTRYRNRYNSSTSNQNNQSNLWCNLFHNMGNKLCHWNVNSSFNNKNNTSNILI